MLPPLEVTNAHLHAGTVVVTFVIMMTGNKLMYYQEYDQTVLIEIHSNFYCIWYFIFALKQQ